MWLLFPARLFLSSFLLLEVAFVFFSFFVFWVCPDFSGVAVLVDTTGAVPGAETGTEPAIGADAGVLVTALAGEDELDAAEGVLPDAGAVDTDDVVSGAGVDATEVVSGPAPAETGAELVTAVVGSLPPEAPDEVDTEVEIGVDTGLETGIETGI